MRKINGVIHNLLKTVTAAGILLVASGTVATANDGLTSSSLAQSPVTATTDQTGISMTTYENSSATELAQMVRSGRVTSEQLVKLAYNKLKADNPTLNAVITTREADALKEARELKDTGQPFYGVPILIKGLTHTIAGGENSNGLAFNKDVVSKIDSRFVQQVRSDGFIPIGQTNFPEMGLFNVTSSIAYGNASNPWNTDYNPGGSSGGSAASVADGITPIATANDAGGSIRIPASWTGLIGLKPTQGIIKTDGKSAPGVVNLAETKSTADLQTFFDTFKGTNIEATPAPANLKSLTIAYSTKSPVGTPVSDDAVKAVENTVAFLKSQGFNVKQVDAPVDGVKLMQGYFANSLSEGSFAEYQAKQKLGRDLQFNDVNPITYALYRASVKAKNDSTAYSTLMNQTKADFADMQSKMAEFHKQYPIYLTPTTATTAPKNDDPIVLPAYAEKIKQMDSLDFNGQMKLIYDAWLHGLSKTPFTQLANISGDPAISLPTYVSGANMPLGVQLEAAKGQDETLITMAKLFEQNNQFKMLSHSDESVTQPKSDASGLVSSGNWSALINVKPPYAGVPASKAPVKVKEQKQPVTEILVYAKKSMYMYQHATFTESQKVEKISKATRPYRDTLLVTGYKRSTEGRLKYHVIDTRNDKSGYITTRQDFVEPLFYSTLPSSKQIKVINAHGIYQYDKDNLTKKLAYEKKGTTLKVKKITHDGNVTRFQLTNGNYVTANKEYVMAIK
ncbi:amidase family protein [Lentilactobacillus sp. Marseille-Q4993]|uniref:amidase family protein n=1 Tax=Lentilactobacillus sp. Marseille-Q4993 TaxID=3039492 RepID=UPI0024BD49DE|nr:amidase family protein [Lentilactobacillus sp. Marseille-Q4993]